MKPYFQPPESCARPEDIDVIDFSSKSSCELRGSCCSGGLHLFNSQGTEIFPFSYFENPWLECDLVRKDNKYINIFHKTRTYGLNFE